MNVVGYIYNKSRPSVRPTKTYAVTDNGNGTYTLTDPCSRDKYILRGLNSAIRCNRYGAEWAVVIDEDDPCNFIWLNDMHGESEKGLILESYSYGNHDIIVAIFKDRVIKLNAKLVGIPFVRADIKSNKVLYFSKYGVSVFNNDVAVETLYTLDKKIEDAERFLGELKAAKKMINDTLKLN